MTPKKYWHSATKNRSFSVPLLQRKYLHHSRIIQNFSFVPLGACSWCAVRTATNYTTTQILYPLGLVVRRCFSVARATTITAYMCGWRCVLFFLFHGLFWRARKGDCPLSPLNPQRALKNGFVKQALEKCAVKHSRFLKFFATAGVTPKQKMALPSSILDYVT